MPHIHTLSHCCFSIVSEKTTRGTPALFPRNKNRMRVHIWRYSVIRECVKHTRSRAHKKVHMVLKSQLRPVALRTSGRAVPCPMRLGVIRGELLG